MSDPLSSKEQLYRIGDLEADLFSDAMDRAVSAHHSVRHGYLRNAERAGENINGEVVARRALAAGFRAYLEEIGPAPETSGKWLPIETAPKDKLVLVSWAGSDSYPIVSRWLRNAQHWTHPFSVEPLPPTHWMPLPASPVKAR